MVVVLKPDIVSLEEYFEYELKAQNKNEFINGKIVPMAYTSEEHGLIVVNIIGELHYLLKNTEARVYPSDRMLYVEGCNRVYYPDIMIVDGASTFYDYKGKMKATTNPSVIIEVLSGSTENIDRHSKWRCYKKLESLQQYILISQEDVYVELYNRATNEKEWLNTDYDSLDDKIIINGQTLEIRDIYRNLAFAEK